MRLANSHSRLTCFSACPAKQATIQLDVLKGILGSHNPRTFSGDKCANPIGITGGCIRQLSCSLPLVTQEPRFAAVLAGPVHPSVPISPAPSPSSTSPPPTVRACGHAAGSASAARPAPLRSLHSLRCQKRLTTPSWARWKHRPAFPQVWPHGAHQPQHQEPATTCSTAPG